MNFDIKRTGRAVLHVTDLEASREFYGSLGFIETESDDDNIFYRAIEDHNHHCLWLRRKPEAAVEVISYRMNEEADLDRLAAFFKGENREIKWMEKGTQKGIGRTLRVNDVSGIPSEFYVEMDKAERMLQRFDLHVGGKVQRIDHFNCAVPDVQKAYDYYIGKLGFRCAEYTTTDEKEIWAAWLHRKPGVHDTAFMNSTGPRLHHIGFWLKDPMGIIDCCDYLAAKGYADSIERGPGRHGLSNAFFLYLRDPDGHRIELYNGDYYTGDSDFEPIEWNINDPQRQTFWGHAAPACWFEEASSFLDVHTGSVVPLGEPALEKKKPNTII